MSILKRFLACITTPAPGITDPTPDQIAQWEQRAPGWVIRCNKCGMVEPFGKYGSRRKGAGKPRNFGRCPQCRKWSWLVIEKANHS